MDNNQENNLRSAIAGGYVSRRWLLKSTVTLAAGTVVISALGPVAAGAAETASPDKGGSPALEAVVDIWDRF